jgi:hypothetical protein
MRDDEEAVQYSKGDCWGCEEVHCGNYFAVVAQERRPSPGRLGIPGAFAHPAQDSTLGEIET